MNVTDSPTDDWDKRNAATGNKNREVVPLLPIKTDTLGCSIRRGPLTVIKLEEDVFDANGVPN